jgi:DNA mismatch repair ATPase MutL
MMFFDSKETRRYSVHVTRVCILLGVELTIDDFKDFIHELEEYNGSRTLKPKAFSRILATKACRGVFRTSFLMSSDNIFPSFMLLLQSNKKCQLTIFVKCFFRFNYVWRPFDKGKM